jgi:hypothetical protein
MLQIQFTLYSEYFYQKRFQWKGDAFCMTNFGDYKSNILNQIFPIKKPPRF